MSAIHPRGTRQSHPVRAGMKQVAVTRRGPGRCYIRVCLPRRSSAQDILVDARQRRFRRRVLPPRKDGPGGSGRVGHRRRHTGRSRPPSRRRRRRRRAVMLVAHARLFPGCRRGGIRAGRPDSGRPRRDRLARAAALGGPRVDDGLSRGGCRTEPPGVLGLGGRSRRGCVVTASRPIYIAWVFMNIRLQGKLGATPRREVRPAR